MCGEKLVCGNCHNDHCNEVKEQGDYCCLCNEWEKPEKPSDYFCFGCNETLSGY